MDHTTTSCAEKRFDNAMDDYRYKLKNRPGMKEYRKKQRSAPASDTGSEFNKGGIAKYKKGSKGAINPGDRDEEEMRAFRKQRQKNAAKIEMVSKLAKRQKKGKYYTGAPGASKATDTEGALTTFNVQKIIDERFKKGKGKDLDFISDRRLASKEGSMKTGGLTGGQKKLDKNKNNRIDAEDFKILRGGRAAMKARRGRLVPLKKDPTKAINSVKPSTGGKGGPPSKTPKQTSKAVEDFLKRRKKLMGLKSIGKGGRIGAAAALLGLAGAGAAKLGQTIGRKYFGDPTKGEKNKMSKPIEKKNKKMGGGMMKRYSKGGGADTGTAGERRSKLMTAVDRFKRRIDVRKRRPKYIKPPERKSMIPADVGQVAQSLTPTGLGKQLGKKVMGKMGGGMMMKPMGYKSGTSVKVKCKLGRNKPTKMY